jgi:hypothetical protein
MSRTSSPTRRGFLAPSAIAVAARADLREVETAMSMRIRERTVRLSIVLAVVLAGFASGAEAQTCPPGTKTASGACARSCPGGYEDRGSNCV